MLTFRKVDRRLRCEVCDASHTESNPLIAKHVIPLHSPGGKNDPTNLRIRCWRHREYEII